MKWILMIVAAALIVVAVGVAVIFRCREKRLIGTLQKMVDRATEGSYEAGRADETMLSLLENSLHRFVKQSQLAEQRAAKQQTRIQGLISDISHQSVTPISNILLYTQLLEERDEQGEYEEELWAIQEQAEKLNFLIDSLVKASRLENGILTVSPCLNPVQELVEQAAGQIRTRAQAKQIDLEIGETSERASFDMKWTAEALFNLVDNAVKYTEPGGQVRLETTSYSMFVRVDVIDSGAGIAEEDHSKIFGRFYRAPQAHDEQGVGLGLYLARKIITLQGGYIKVSSALGKGSRFSLFLPRSELLPGSENVSELLGKIEP